MFVDSINWLVPAGGEVECVHNVKYDHRHQVRTHIVKWRCCWCWWSWCWCCWSTNIETSSAPSPSILPSCFLPSTRSLDDFYWNVWYVCARPESNETNWGRILQTCSKDSKFYYSCLLNICKIESKWIHRVSGKWVAIFIGTNMAKLAMPLRPPCRYLISVGTGCFRSRGK